MTREVKEDGQTGMVVGQGGMDTRTPVWRRHVTGAASASSRLRIGVGDFGNCWDTSKHKEVSHEQEVCSPAVG